MKEFKDTLRKLIDKTGQSVNAWAKANGMNQQTIQRLIDGDRRPNWETVQKIAKALKVSTEALRDR